MSFPTHASIAAPHHVVRSALTILFALSAATAAAQGPVSIGGTVVTPDGAPLSGAVVTSSIGGADTTDSRGSFDLPGARVGSMVTLRVSRLGYAPAERSTTVGAAENRLRIVLAEQAVELAGVVVSATGEARLIAETPVAVATVSAAEIRDARPRHPGQIMARMAGVWVGATSGEGHMTAIRQPKSTKPMYLFLEDGVPTRSTGFFNHNALYEINVPQAERIEVLKGPGTALYGSDAIGGVINVETRGASLTPGAQASLEAGSNGWSRILLGGGGTFGDHGLHADLNYTRSGGYQTGTAYDRLSGTVRWDAYLPGNATVRTVASYSAIDQGEGSALSAEDFSQRPTANYNPIAFRQIQAFRLSSAFEKPFAKGLLSVTPFVRHNRMEILPFWMLSFDPVIYETGHQSIGALSRARYDLPFWSGQVVGGADLEYSPGFRRESTIRPTRDGRIFTAYTRADRIYDYDVAFRGVSPYLQAEISPLPQVRVSVGARYDRIGYEYDSHLEPTATGRWRRPADATLWYGHLSPKVGLTINPSTAFGVFASYRNGFRAPSEGQLFRQGSSSNGPDLEPVTVDSWEGGIRGQAGGVSYELSAYRMDIRNDILTHVTRVGNAFDRVNVNAGQTRHAGVEIAVGTEVLNGLRLDASYSNALHTYRDWVLGNGVAFSGNRMESAPRTISNLRASYSPACVPSLAISGEWSRIGGYYMDPANEHEYEGHDLLNLRLKMPLTRTLELDGGVANLLGRRYAESAAFNAAEGETFNPGAPRTLNLAVAYRWQR